MSVNTWYFEPTSSCSVIIWVVFVWSVFPLCSLRSKLHIMDHQWSFMDCYDEKSWDLSSLFVMEICNKGLGEIFYFLFSDNVFIYFFKELFSLSILSVVLYMCIKKVSVIMGISIGLIWSFGSSNRTEFTFSWWRSVVAWKGSVLDVSVFLLTSLGHDKFVWFFWGSCSLDAF